MKRFVKLSGGMLAALLILASPARAEVTLWLVQPLYPGQEALVDRTEKALDKLIAPTDRKEHVIGRTELAKALQGKKIEELPCLSTGDRCADPIDPFVATLGFGRIVLLQGGQDEAGFKFRVTSYEPALGKVVPTSSSAPVLEKALLGAVAKVVPVASTLEVKSTPPGATVYVDDTKMGTTPLSTQVLPGERVIKIDLKLHQPVEESIVVPIKGSASLEKALEKVAARLIITAAPAGTTIFIDGNALGKDRVDRGINPGQHTIRLTAENHKAFEQTISVKPDEQYVLDKTLEPLPGAVVVNPNPVRQPDNNVIIVTKQPDGVVKIDTPLVPPPPPPTQTELTYERRSYFQLSYEYGSWLGNALVGRRWGNAGTGRTTSIETSSRTLMGGSLEYGTGGKYFGVAVVGLSYLTNVERFNLGVGFAPGAAREVDAGIMGPSLLNAARIHLITVRALQPQLRLAAWRFMFQLQIGAEFRTGQIVEPGTTFYKDGFMVLDLLAAARFNLRFFVVDGLYFFGSGHFTYYILGETSRMEAPVDDMGNATGPEPSFKNAHSWGFNVGLGYGF